MVMSEKRKLILPTMKQAAIIGRLVPSMILCTRSPSFLAVAHWVLLSICLKKTLFHEPTLKLKSSVLCVSLVVVLPKRRTNRYEDAVTTGASNDIERATQLARNMVTKWGLTDKMGPVLYGEEESQVPGGGNTNYSEDTSREIDQEAKIIDAAYKRR